MSWSDGAAASLVPTDAGVDHRAGIFPVIAVGLRQRLVDQRELIDEEHRSSQLLRPSSLTAPPLVGLVHSCVRASV